jgi:hypothetical protein
MLSLLLHLLLPYGSLGPGSCVHKLAACSALSSSRPLLHLLLCESCAMESSAAEKLRCSVGEGSCLAADAGLPPNLDASFTGLRPCVQYMGQHMQGEQLQPHHTRSDLCINSMVRTFPGEYKRRNS